MGGRAWGEGDGPGLGRGEGKDMTGEGSGRLGDRQGTGAVALTLVLATLSFRGGGDKSEQAWTAAGMQN